GGGAAGGLATATGRGGGGFGFPSWAASGMSSTRSAGKPGARGASAKRPLRRRKRSVSERRGARSLAFAVRIRRASWPELRGGGGVSSSTVTSMPGGGTESTWKKRGTGFLPLLSLSFLMGAGGASLHLGRSRLDHAGGAATGASAAPTSWRLTGSAS